MCLHAKPVCRSLIPDWLKVLTFSEVCLLRPLKFHYGDYQRMQHGYRQKNGMCHVTWENVSIEEGLAALEDEHSKRGCQQACLWPNLYPYTEWCETILKGNESLYVDDEPRRKNLDWYV